MNVIYVTELINIVLSEFKYLNPVIFYGYDDPRIDRVYISFSKSLFLVINGTCGFFTGFRMYQTFTHDVKIIDNLTKMDCYEIDEVFNNIIFDFSIKEDDKIVSFSEKELQIKTIITHIKELIMQHIEK